MKFELASGDNYENTSPFKDTPYYENRLPRPATPYLDTPTKLRQVADSAYVVKPGWYGTLEPNSRYESTAPSQAELPLRHNQPMRSAMHIGLPSRRASSRSQAEEYRPQTLEQCRSSAPDVDKDTLGTLKCHLEKLAQQQLEHLLINKAALNKLEFHGVDTGGLIGQLAKQRVTVQESIRKTYECLGIPLPPKF